MIESPREPSIKSESDHTIKLRRPTNRLQRLDHAMASSFFNDEQSTIIKRRVDDSETQKDHDYPFQGSKHLDPIGINEHPVRLSHRTKFDFYKVDKLEIKKPALSKTQYELYTSKSAGRVKTRGFFQNDPERVKMVKNPGEFQLSDVQNLLRLNPEMREYLARQQRVEDKKLNGAKR